MLCRLLLVGGLLCLLQEPPLSNCQEVTPEPQPYSAPGSCLPQSQFFRTGDLSCAECSENQITAGDGFSCECSPRHYRPAASGTSTFECQSCAQANTVTTTDGLFCLECNGTAYDEATGQCESCSSVTEIFVDILPSSQSDVGTRSCVSCPEGTWADHTRFRCVECGVPDCTQCTVVSGGLCINLNPVTPPVLFSYYTEHLTAAADQCRAVSNATACQLLANLCVLRTYLRSDPACEWSLELAGPHLPPLYYFERGAGQVLEETTVNTQLLTREGTDGLHLLPLVLASFSLNGTFLGLEEELTQQILLCKDRPSRAGTAWRVGVYYIIRCSLSVSELLQYANSPVFYDLFLLDEAEDMPTQLIPVPVLVTNYRTPSGEAVNEGEDRGGWQLVRRFFLAEALSNDPQYVERMELIVELTLGGDVRLPYLKITYTSWTPEQDANSFTSAYVSSYTKNEQPLVLGLSITTAILTVLAMVYAALKTNGFLRRSGGLFCEPHTFVYLFVELCAALSTVLFVLLFVSATFYLLFFKSQFVFTFSLPRGHQELVFEVLLGIALFCRVVQIVYLVWHQCTIDIFFMDWERSKGLLLGQATNQNPDTASSSEDGPPPVVAAAAGSASPAPISIWRTYFVANEWNEIQSIRKVDHTLLLMLVLLFIQVIGLGDLGKTDPVSSVGVSIERYSAPPSDILRFSITSLHFIIISAIMRIYVFLIHERYVEHKLHQFVDLCSVSNISVFLMPHKLFGHYIHGHSVHGHADTGMREMNRNLLKEQEGLCGRRGLELDSDLQTYEIALTPQFRTQFDKVLTPIRAEKAEGRGGATGAGGGATTQQGEGQGLSEAVLQAYSAMNQLLTAFCERSIHGLDYSIKDKLLPERVLAMEFHDTENNSLFYRDPGYSFDSVLFYGNFWSLFQLDLLLFAMVDLFAHNFLLAAIITYIVSWLVNIVRDALGRRNLSRKTLVDSRFLI